jgi:hypothetical protein
MAAAVLGLTGLLAAACSDPAGRQGISGRVTFEGQPLKSGQIEFRPSGNEPYQAGAVIKKGTYKIAAAQGLSPGTYRVFISHMTGGLTPEEREAGKKPKRAVEVLPAKYNAKSQLTVEVKPGTNKFDFDLNN